MRRVLSTSLLAVAFAAVSVSAQEATIKSKTKINSDDAKPATFAGCLTGGPTGYMLTNVAGNARSRDHAIGTSGVVAEYDLTPREGVDLSSHVGERVEISAIMVKAATKHDDDAKVEIRNRTKVEADHQPDQTSKSTTKAEIPRGPLPKLAVMTVRTISPTCS